jgi:DNA gyrase subunit A
MEQIIISEIPYQVNKATLHIKIADLVKEDRIQGISDVRDESDRNGVRLVVDVKRDAMANIILSKLYKYTPLQTSYGVNNVTLVNGRPKLLNLKQLIEEFLKFRMEIIIRRTEYDLRKAEERAHILEGYLIALDHLDEVIQIIRSSKDPEEAQNRLIKRFEFSEIQAKAILDMRLQRLTGLEREKIQNEYDELIKTIAYFKELLANEHMRYDVMKEEFLEIKERYGDHRRTEIKLTDGEISIEDMIPNEQVVVTISSLGYIKRTKLDEYRSQGRGGRGSRGSKTREEDAIEHLFVSSNHNYLLLFTESGICHWLRIYEIPEASKNSSGRVIQNLLAIPKDDNIRAYINVADLEDTDFLQSNYIVFATKKGQIKRTSLEAFSRPRSNGIIAISIREDDQLLEARLTKENGQIIMANKNGRAIRFNVDDVRSMGRTASGVRGMSLDDDLDEIVGMVVFNEEDDDYSLLVVSENGMGKRSALEDYRLTKRGGKGVKTLQISNKTGKLIALKAVRDDFDLMITNTSGIVIRLAVKDMRIMGRATQGVRLINLYGDDQIADVAVVKKEEEGEEE